MVKLVAREHGRIFGATRVEHVHALDRVTRALLLPGRCLLSRQQSVTGKDVVGHGVEHHAKLFCRLLVVAVLKQLPSELHTVIDGRLVVTHHVAVGSYGL